MNRRKFLGLLGGLGAVAAIPACCGTANAKPTDLLAPVESTSPGISLDDLIEVGRVLDAHDVPAEGRVVLVDLENPLLAEVKNHCTVDDDSVVMRDGEVGRVGNFAIFHQSRETWLPMS